MRDYRVPTLETIEAICGSLDKWRWLSLQDQEEIYLHYSNSCALCEYDLAIRKDLGNCVYCAMCPIDIINGGGSCDATPWGQIDDAFGTEPTSDESPTRIELLAVKEYEFLVRVFLYAVYCYQESKPMTILGYAEYTYPDA